MKAPRIPVSWGELFDKISILELKMTSPLDINAKKHVETELSILSCIADRTIHGDVRIQNLVSSLTNINRLIWETENELRKKEKDHVFDREFILLARQVYKNNDERARIKKEINKMLSSEIVEEKSYS